MIQNLFVSTLVGILKTRLCQHVIIIAPSWLRIEPMTVRRWGWFIRRDD